MLKERAYCVKRLIYCKYLLISLCLLAFLFCKLKERFNFSGGCFYFNQRRSLWQSCIFGHEFTHRWRNISMWHYLNLDLSAGASWSCKTSPGCFVFRILFLCYTNTFSEDLVGTEMNFCIATFCFQNVLCFLSVNYLIEQFINKTELE